MTATSVPNEALVMAGTELLLSMVEARLARNGNGTNLDSADKTQEELEKIEQQIARMQAAAGQDEDKRREIQLVARPHCRHYAKTCQRPLQGLGKNRAGAASAAALHARLH